MAKVLSLALRREALTLRRIPILSMLARWRALHRQRRDLAALDDHLLRDIGITRRDAETEARRPAWDAPEHWRRRW